MISNGYGRIITVSGLNAFHGRPNWSHICGSKMGAIGMTRALATELAQYGILVNHVVPGAYVAHPDLNRIPLGRVGLAQELANTYAFRASEDASYITGQTFHVNGGEIRG
jgi:3-oxoacyl-[acyl-carrier protein] reductase